MVGDMGRTARLILLASLAFLSVWATALAGEPELIGMEDNCQLAR